jgi:hypothetical protein
MEGLEDRIVYQCGVISRNISNQMTISERTLMSFSLLVSEMIKTGMPWTIPPIFNKVGERLERFWFYQAYQEKNLEKCFSYMRAFQIYRTYQVYVASKKQKEQLVEDVKRFKKEFSIISTIYDNPGITPKDLRCKLGITKSSLTTMIKPLIDCGYIVEYMFLCKHLTYSLSNSGLELYGLMKKERS